MISRGQLLRLGVSGDQIEKAVQSATLFPVFRGAYAVGHPAIGQRGRMQAAILACGPGTAISHRSAASLHGLTERIPSLTHVIGPGERGRGCSGIRWHRVPAPHRDEVTVRDGIPCTTVSRTIVDLAGNLGTKTLRGLIEEAAIQRSLDVPVIDTILSRRRRRGAPRLRAVLTPWRTAGEDRPMLRSRLEARLYPRLVRWGHSLPRTNQTLCLDGVRIEVDFLWAEEKLVVETDGAATHATAPAFRRDRWRDQILVAAGYRVIRVTWDQMTDEPEALLARIIRILEG